MEISEEQIKMLASHIVANLKCECKCTLDESMNQPCACGWTHIMDMFNDDFGIELKLYPEELKKWYKENY